MHIHHKRIHFVGIGGAGMSALAEIMLNLGHRVSGSDMNRTQITARLETLGIPVQYSHEPDLITSADLVVYSSAVGPGNPERVYAEKNAVACIRRAEMLGDIMRTQYSIGIAGTHGKTTTTSLIGQVLSHAGLNPTVIVGGTMRVRGANAILGGGSLLVAEADEYDRSFLSMWPSLAVITNIEADHLDCYRDIDDIKAAFIAYAGKVPFYGAVFACADDPGTRSILPSVRREIVTYGTSEDAQYRAGAVETGPSGTTFHASRGRIGLGRVSTPLSGLHNVRNCLAAIAVCTEMGVAFSAVCEGLRNFSGIRRRFEKIGSERGVTVIDDYAHHPSEIAATLGAARLSEPKRIVAVFQPHLYTRTRDFMDEFAASLKGADTVIVTGIYKARERCIPGVTAETIVERMLAGGYAGARFVQSKEEAADMVVTGARDGDMVVLMGAGDICDIGPVILERVRNG